MKHPVKILPLLALSCLCTFAPSTLYAQPQGGPQGGPPGGPPSPWSIGVLFTIDTQPYKNVSSKGRVLPSVSYRGERLSINGPLIQYRLFEADRLRVNVNAAYQFAPYEADDGRIFDGMDSPSGTMIAGFDMRYSLADILSPRWSLVFTAESDTLGEHNGHQISAGAAYALGSPRSKLSGGLGFGLLYQDANWTNYFVKVPDNKAIEGRPAYSGSTSLNPYVSLRGMYIINRHWSILGIARLDVLDDSWTDSPLVEDSTRAQVFTALNYTF